MKVRTQEGLPEESASTLGQRGDEGRKKKLKLVGIELYLPIELGPRMGSQILKLQRPQGCSKPDLVSISKRSNLDQNGLPKQW